jgi:hypothetical protein
MHPKWCLRHLRSMYGLAFDQVLPHAYLEGCDSEIHWKHHVFSRLMCVSTAILQAINHREALIPALHARYDGQIRETGNWLVVSMRMRKTAEWTVHEVLEWINKKQAGFVVHIIKCRLDPRKKFNVSGVSLPTRDMSSSDNLSTSLKVLHCWGHEFSLRL